MQVNQQPIARGGDTARMHHENSIADQTRRVLANRMSRGWISWLFLAGTAACGDSEPRTEAIAVAGEDQEVQKGDRVVLDGSASHDTSGEDVTHYWSLFTPPGSLAVIIDDGAGIASFTTDVPGTYEVRLLVYGPSGNSVPDSVIVTALNGDPVVVFDVAEELDTQVGATVEIDSTASQDPDGDPVIRYWTLWRPEGSGVRLESEGSLVGRFVPDVAGEYRVWLTLSDGFATSVGEVRVVASDEVLP